MDSIKRKITCRPLLNFDVILTRPRYGRILSRIKESQYAKKVLQWMVCAKTPLREAEVLQALLVKPLLTDFQKQRKAWVDVQRECGPIIEIRDGVVRFVHFTAQE